MRNKSKATDHLKWKAKLDRIKIDSPNYLLNFLLDWYDLNPWTRKIPLLKTLAKKFQYSGIAYRAPATSEIFCPSSWSKDLKSLKTFLASDVTQGLIIKSRLTQALDLEELAKYVIQQTKTKDIEVYNIRDAREIVCLVKPSEVEVVQKGKPYSVSWSLYLSTIKR